jgi:hypothetical protein
MLVIQGRQSWVRAGIRCGPLDVDVGVERTVPHERVF